MFVKPLTYGQMAQLVTPQIQAQKVADRHLDSVVPCVMGGRLVPVAVHCEALILGQLWNLCQPVRG